MSFTLKMFSYGLKCSQPIRLQCFFIINISGRNQSISYSTYFCIEIIIKNKYHLRIPFLIWKGQLYLLPNQITWFFVSLSLEKTNHYFIFLHWDNHQEKATSESNSFGWVWSIVLLIQSDCRICWSSISVEKIRWYL